MNLSSQGRSERGATLLHRVGDLIYCYDGLTRGVLIALPAFFSWLSSVGYVIASVVILTQPKYRFNKSTVG